jgi:acyl carrier protein
VEQIYQSGEVEAVYNLYGPSEDTTYSTYTMVERGAAGEPTIGRPIANTQAYILDAHMQPVPVGVRGELYLGGDGLARGYLHRPDLTAERFIPHPFSMRGGERVYRTGDVARYRAGGEIEFLGRVDHQVKVRGYRIELGEIEAALRRQEQVRDAVVVVREEEGAGKRLVAYIVLDAGKVDSHIEEEAGEHTGDRAEEHAREHTREHRGKQTGEVAGEQTGERIRERLREQLPGYLVPQWVVVLDELPLTPNGKVDRAALPAPQRKARDEDALPVRMSETEEMVAQVWAAVLGVERVGREESFFELGGHSLLATQAVFRLREAFDIELPLRALMEEPTVRALSVVIDSLVGERTQAAAPVHSIRRIAAVSREGHRGHKSAGKLVSLPEAVERTK